MIRPFLAPICLLIGTSACGPSYSPNTYAGNAVQQANKAEQGVVVGVRPVAISAAGTVGAVAGAAAGGIGGAQFGVGPVSAFSALGGTLVGGLAGTAVEHASADTNGYEYIVRKANAELVSVTQKDRVPLVVGQKVLVIAGNQARVVPDYTVSLTPGGAAAAEAKPPAGAPGQAAASSSPSGTAAATSPAPNAPLPGTPPLGIGTASPSGGGVAQPPGTGTVQAAAGTGAMQPASSGTVQPAATGTAAATTSVVAPSPSTVTQPSATKPIDLHAGDAKGTGAGGAATATGMAATSASTPATPSAIPAPHASGGS